jgi:hypothetical protein
LSLHPSFSSPVLLEILQFDTRPVFTSGFASTS